MATKNKGNLSGTKGTAKTRKTPFTTAEAKLLKKLARQVNYDLTQNSETSRPVEQLSFQSDISRATI